LTSTFKGFCSNGHENVSVGIYWSQDNKLKSASLNPELLNIEENDSSCSSFPSLLVLVACVWQNSTHDSYYNGMCLLLTVPKLSDHSEYANWNPSNARVKCFNDVCPLVEKFLTPEKKSTNS
jgi:hypothetical protein